MIRDMALHNSALHSSCSTRSGCQPLRPAWSRDWVSLFTRELTPGSQLHSGKQNRGLRVCAAAPTKATELPTWQQLSACAGASALEGYTVRRYEVPNSVPTPTLPTSADAATDKPVLLYSDTNAWCPYCERVKFALHEKDVPYDTVLIDLYAKPDWYKELVPTMLTPAARINGELVWESMDILNRLEREFAERPLLPADGAARAEAEAVAADAESLAAAGFKWIAGGSLSTQPGAERPPPPDEAALQEMQAAFEGHLAKFEAQLGKHEGPFLLGRFSLADIAYAPAMERLGANLPAMRGWELRRSPDYPRTSEWFAALEARPAYQRVKSDDTTHNLVFSKIFRVPMRAAAPASEAQAAARREAAAKVAANRSAVLADILKNSGIVRGRSNQYGNTLQSVNGYEMEPSPAAVAAVEWALRRLCSYLLHGTSGPKHPHLEAAPLGSAALTFFAQRASAPRDLSAAAATELRTACYAVLKEMY